MEKIEIKDLNFRYSLEKKNAIENINLTVNDSDFIVICGRSGSGKTTLLKMLDSAVHPTGTFDGEVLYDGKSYKSVDEREVISSVGFVNQNDFWQGIGDTVYHELTFGNENLNLDNDKIFKSTAEVCAFFGIADLYDKRTSELSGGEMKLVNLASVVSMMPKFLLLDEPLTKLDPVAAGKFADMCRKLNRLYGMTIAVTEHNIDPFFDLATRIIFIDDGKIIFDLPPRQTGENKKFTSFLPEFARIYSSLYPDELLPLSPTECKNRLREKQFSFDKADNNKKTDEKTKPIIELKNVTFAYDRNKKMLLRNADFSLPRGKIVCLFGSNGSGKSTLCKLVSGALNPVGGKILYDGGTKKKTKLKVSFLPQNPLDVLIKSTVGEDLNSVGTSEQTEKIAAELQIDDLLGRHPFDMSGGQSQRAAIAKILLTNPDVLILDEPTKGLDRDSRAELTEIIKNLKSEGKTFLIVTHDTSFAAQTADYCSILFDGHLSAPRETEEFMDENLFYTTDKSLIMRHLIQEKRGGFDEK